MLFGFKKKICQEEDEDVEAVNKIKNQPIRQHLEIISR